jgi:L-ascorbate metabolism protein UlaG (beta-lactamase superfamily)
MGLSKTYSGGIHMKKVWLVLSVVCLLIVSGLSLAQDSKKISIYYGGNTQVELISPEGTRVLIDVYDPSLLSAPATEKDILLTTRSHSFHVSSLTNNFPGQTLYVKVGEITTGDVVIKSIPSSHKDDNAFKQELGSNYIFIIDMGGLRIAHFGDIGQAALTPEQLEALGMVDIAVTQFHNLYSDMDLVNLKGFNLMDQVKPKLIIPSHEDIETMKYAAKKWKAYCTPGPLQVGAADLEGPTKLVFIGEKKRLMSKIAKASPWEEN